MATPSGVRRLLTLTLELDEAIIAQMCAGDETRLAGMVESAVRYVHDDLFGLGDYDEDHTDQ